MAATQTPEAAPLDVFLRDLVRAAVAGAGTVTRYRPPLVGFADADDPRWARLKELADPNHRLPSDLLPGARTVVAFFLPFDAAVVRANRRGRGPAPEWVLAYRETNALIASITRQLTEALAERGVRAAAEPPTHNFDPATLSCRWSHRSAAAIAGLGTFGLHRLLITEAGCAGRFGSLAIDATVTPTPPPAREHCLHFAGAKCRACVEACPVGALTVAGPSEPNLDRQRCWTYLLRLEAEGGADCCGKCSLGPCALKAPGLPG